MSLLGWYYFNDFMDPLALVLVAPVLILLVLELFAHAPGALSISTGEVIASLKGGSRRALKNIPPLLRAAGLVLLIVALARPIVGYHVKRDRADVVDVMMCVDVSGTMLSQDFVSGGKRLDRLSVTKQAAHDFLNNRKQRTGDRFGLDRVGLILYATYAWTQCPLTLDYGVLGRELDRAHVNTDDPTRQRTAIGSAIGLAVSRLRKSEAKSKVIILLTDGRNNSGELSPLTAANMAKDAHIRVYTIGAGSTEGGLIPTQTFFGTQLRRISEGVDEEALKNIAATTGAKYYRASDTSSLEQAYKEINELETTQVELGDYYEHDENFVPYAFAGALLIAASLFARRAWFEVIP